MSDIGSLLVSSATRQNTWRINKC